MSSLKNDFLNDLKMKIEILNNDPLEIISLLCRSYLFVENKQEKEEVTKNVISYLNNYKNYNLIKFILDKNIVVNKGELIVSQWIIINKVLKRKEYKLNKIGDEYEVIYLKDSNDSKVLEV